MASMNDAPTVAQLKHAIDHGDTGDKVPGFDPGAAALGTDAEAGGAPPSSAEITQALDAETSRGVRSDADPDQAAPPEASIAPAAVGPSGSVLLPMLLGATLALLLAAAILLLVRHH